jgi:hypothetical protein
MEDAWVGEGGMSLDFIAGVFRHVALGCGNARSNVYSRRWGPGIKLQDLFCFQPCACLRLVASGRSITITNSLSVSHSLSTLHFLNSSLPLPSLQHEAAAVKKISEASVKGQAGQ